VEIEGVEMLTLVGGLCYVGFINPVGVDAGVRRQTSFCYWAHLSRFCLKTETQSYLRNVLFFK
jgi:hypothetical protein